MPAFDRERLLRSLRSTCRTARQEAAIDDWSVAPETDGERDPLDDFAQLVDESPYALEDWLEALKAFHTWLADHEPPLEAPAGSVLGYLHCCTLTLARTVNLPSFTDQLLSSLEQYGFDASVEAKAEEG